MLYAILSDIHANLDALNVVLDDIDQRKPDRTICLGDIVGYCADPAEAIQKSRTFNVTLMGNHDFAVNDRTLIEKFNFHARLAIEWTIDRLTEDEKKYLSGLPYSHEENDMTFVHATPRNPEGWGYLANIDDALDAFNYFETPLCFIGHTHYPVIVSDKGMIISDRRFTFKKNMRYIVNIGSVGQPRDGNPKACYVLYDSDEGTLEYVRLKYAVESTQAHMLKARFPQFLINRLSEGR
ncbi:MAG: metallophosphoesterase family protein [Fibrobacterota bacterium]